jgi:hypothetical protein
MVTIMRPVAMIARIDALAIAQGDGHICVRFWAI